VHRALRGYRGYRRDRLAVGAVASLVAAAAMHRLAEVPARDLARWAERRLRVPPRSTASPPPGQSLQPLWAAEGGLFRHPDRPA
jgi:hypothetical protein